MIPKSGYRFSEKRSCTNKKLGVLQSDHALMHGAEKVATGLRKMMHKHGI
jgi:hypothetical protein